jgi:hypothetical protein
MHAAGIDLLPDFYTMRPVIDNCCALSDTIIAHLLFSHDFWNLGVREFPFCGDVPSAAGGGCVEPADVFAEEVPTVCGNLCKRNGVCEDGGFDAEGHNCGWGGDCEDCGPRDRTNLPVASSSSYSSIAYGKPHQAAYEEAVVTMCTTIGGVGCHSALTDKYTEFHGEDNLFSSILDTLCAETTCVLEGTFLDVEIPESIGGTTCCLAAQVMAGYLSKEMFHAKDLSQFDGLCAPGADLKAAASFNLSCTEGLWDDDGDVDSVLLYPDLDLTSYHLAADTLCSSAGCVAAAEDILTDLRREESLGNAAVVVFHLPLERVCMAAASSSSLDDEIEVCSMLPFAEYFTEAGRTTSASTNSMTCCLASAIILAEVVRQAGEGRFSTASCPGGSSCDTVVNMLDTRLGEAKDVLRGSTSCHATTWAVVELMRAVESEHEFFVHFDDGLFRDFVDSEETCWLQWALPPTSVGLPAAACEAADALLAQYVWHEHPSIAQDIYVASPAHLFEDDAGTALVLSSICASASASQVPWAATLDAVVSGTSVGELLDGFSFETLCDDPCRCKTDVVNAVGCGLHPLYADLLTTHQRPFCFVDPSCGASVPYVLADGKDVAWAYCSVGRDTCQQYSGQGPCQAFIPEGTKIFVPAGTTQEGLQQIEDAYDVAAEETGLVAGSNLLKTWFQEAALVSASCLSAHGQLVCDSRMRRCQSASPGSVIVQPQSVCAHDCAGAADYKVQNCAGEVIFNDMLRSFEEGVICKSRLLPSRLSAAESGLDYAEIDRLQAVLGTDMLLRKYAENQTKFGEPIYGVSGGGNPVCFSSSSEGITMDLDKAVEGISCPSGFVKNNGPQLCVGPCPSVTLTNTEYWVLWCLYAVPGIVALGVNCAASYVGSKAKDVDGLTKNTIRLSIVASLLGAVPLVLFRHNLVCTCDTELCFRGNDALCALNKMSIYVLMATCLCLLHKFWVLFGKLKKNSVARYDIDRWKSLQLTWVVPLILAIVSFLVEDTENERFHLARAGVMCQFRYKTSLEEVLLLHVPMCACTAGLAYFIAQSLRLCIQVMMLQHETICFKNFWKVFNSKLIGLKRMAIVGSLSVLLMSVWVGQAVSSRVVFAEFFESMDVWLKCVRFDFARRATVGQAWDGVVREFDGTECPSEPSPTGLFTSQVLKAIFEGLLPCMVAMTFSWKILQDHKRFRDQRTDVVKVKHIIDEKAAAKRQEDKKHSAFDFQAYERDLATVGDSSGGSPVIDLASHLDSTEVSGGVSSGMSSCAHSSTSLASEMAAKIEAMAASNYLPQSSSHPNLPSHYSSSSLSDSQDATFSLCQHGSSSSVAVSRGSSSVDSAANASFSLSDLTLKRQSSRSFDHTFARSTSVSPTILMSKSEEERDPDQAASLESVAKPPATSPSLFGMIGPLKISPTMSPLNLSNSPRGMVPTMELDSAVGLNSSVSVGRIRSVRKNTFL